MKNRLTKAELFTIPNFMSFFRILLIPVIIVLYCRLEKPYETAAVVVLSAVTDFADGRIARRFNMVSDLGKFLDPLADKLTQGAMMLCLLSSFPWMYALLAILLIKESFQLAAGLVIYKRTGTVSSANWYGKVSTGILYAVMLCLFLFPHLNAALTRSLLTLCAVALSGSMVLYAVFFARRLKDAYHADGGANSEN